MPSTPPSNNSNQSAGMSTKIETSTNQYYDGTIEGLRKYLNDIEEEKPQVFKALNSDLRDLEKKENTAKIISWIGLGGGILLFVGAFTFMAKEEVGYGGTKSKVSNTGAMMAGLGVMLVPLLINPFIKPDRDDYMDFLNKHNRINKDSPLKWQIGLIPSEKKILPYLGLAYNY